MESVFSRLPETFFVPLASPNKRHYAALLLTYYRLFMEYRSSVERELVVARYSEYFATLDGTDQIAREEGTGLEEQGPVEPDPAAAPTSAATQSDGAASSAMAEPAGSGRPDPRSLANLFLRKLILYGWLDEEEQVDFSRVITLCAHAQPFLEALDATERGTSIEYESHIVAVYSSLCSDAARENGEHAVLNAHWHTRLLVESLKLLDQNIRNHVQEMFRLDAAIPEILHTHYDVYMQEVVDRAYTRLKTSDNLSRYRPRIARAVGSFLKNEQWMTRTAERLSTIQRTTVAASRETVRQMLVEIQDELKGIDPMLESIDDKNRRYSRISTERIRARLHSDSSLEGKIARIVRALARGTLGAQAEELGHRIFRLRHLTQGSLYVRRNREMAESALLRRGANELELDIAAAELKLRVANQLNPAKIAEFLARYCPTAGTTRSAEEIVVDVDSFVRIIYAANYAEARDGSFPFSVDWRDEVATVGKFRFRSHRFARRHPDG